jgi:hypothetical protein
MANDLLSIINNNLQQEGATSNSFLRRQQIRQEMEDGRLHEGPTDATTNPVNSSPTQLDPNGTLANTYQTMLNNYNGSSSGQPQSATGTMPSWLPIVASTGMSLAGQPLLGGVLSSGLKMAQGDTANALGTLAGLFTSQASEGKLPSGLVGTLVSGLYRGDDSTKLGGNLLNSGLGYLAGAINPMAGLAYSLARMAGLNVAQGIADNSKSDATQRTDAGYNGGYFGNGSWSVQNPYSPTNTYSGSGYGNIAGPGSNMGTTEGGYTPSSNPSGYSPGSAYGTTGYGTTTSTSEGGGGGE